jgi:hypothetical protein
VRQVQAIEHAAALRAAHPYATTLAAGGVNAEQPLLLPSCRSLAASGPQLSVEHCLQALDPSEIDGNCLVVEAVPNFAQEVGTEESRVKADRTLLLGTRRDLDYTDALVSASVNNGSP